MKKQQNLPSPGLTGLAAKILIVLLLLTNSMVLEAQQKQITGSLKTASGEVIADATVLLTNSQGLVLQFSRSDNHGNYLLSLPDSAHSAALFVEVNHLAFAKVRQPVTAAQLVYNFVLEKKVVTLPEVAVKSKPVIDRRGDTLSFSVSAFARPEDRTIGDVLKHMPGISVGDNGQIFYNGQPISNLYIHGDDLMNGNYTLVPRTVSKDLIKSVEIVQHHQPIKALRNRKPTDNVALNLVLKNENSLKLSGQAMLGAGLPQQSDAALNGILFNKKFKMLNTLKANNSGVDYTDDFAQYGAGSFPAGMEMSRPISLLSAATAGTPNLPRSNYYFNRSATVNANNLVNTKSEWQLRSNIQAFFDRNTLNYESREENYLNGDTIRYNEWQSQVNTPFLVNTSLSATVNKDRNYFNNNIFINISGKNNNNYQDFNGNAFRQQLHERTCDLSGFFHWIPEQKSKNLLEMKWYVNYYNSPQHLFIGSGLMPEILNEGQPYSFINQYAKTPTLLSHAIASYHAGNNAFKKNFEAGILNEWQTLSSALRLTQNNNTETGYTGDAGNDLHWQRHRGYFNSSFSIVKNAWTAGLEIPLSWQSIQYYQDAYALNSRHNRFFINPALRFTFFPNAEDEVTIRYNYKNKVGNIGGVYRGAILSNYRSLFANDADLQEQNSSGTGIAYKLQRAILMLFANAGINYSSITTNSIRSSVLTSNVQRTVLLPYENDQSTWSAYAGISKYLLFLKTTASVKANFTRNRSNQFINNELLPYNNDAFSLMAGIDSRLFSVITLNYNGTGVWSASRMRNKEGMAASKLKQLIQNATVGYSPFKNCFLNLKGRHFDNIQASMENTNYLFMDLIIRYKLAPWHMDLELNVSNLTNVKNYQTFHLNANQFAVDSYHIRGRMAVLRATFNL